MIEYLTLSEVCDIYRVSKAFAMRLLFNRGPEVLGRTIRTQRIHVDASDSDRAHAIVRYDAADVAAIVGTGRLNE
jgi:hypothetical protein